MHVALFSPAWPLEKNNNGIVTYVHWMRLELERLGHRVSVFTGRLDTVEHDPRVHLVERSGAGSAWHRVVKRLVSIERQTFGWGRVIAAQVVEVHRHDPIDIIEMEESFGWFDDVESLTAIPVLVKLHGPAFLSLIGEELSTPMGRRRVAREGKALARAAAIASPAMDTLTKTIARYRLAPRIQQHVVNPLAVANELPLWQLEGSDPQHLLFVGRFDLRKGADVVLRALALLLKERPQLSLTFVGPDEGLLQPDGTRLHFEAFRDRLLPVELHRRIDYRGRLPNREIATLRCRARVIVVASRWENQGYTALEAMMQGCPVVASDVGGNPESVIHHRTGLLARSEDPADFAAQLAIMLDDPEAAAAMGAAARQHVIENHSTHRVALESLALYRRVIANQRV